jgi:hypothetical protein
MLDVRDSYSRGLMAFPQLKVLKSIVITDAVFVMHLFMP